jgi:hypothetical protein
LILDLRVRIHLTSVGFVLVLHLYKVEEGLLLQSHSSTFFVVCKERLGEINALIMRKVKEKKWALNIVFGVNNWKF